MCYNFLINEGMLFSCDAEYIMFCNSTYLHSLRMRINNLLVGKENRFFNDVEGNIIGLSEDSFLQEEVIQKLKSKYASL